MRTQPVEGVWLSYPLGHKKIKPQCTENEAVIALEPSLQSWPSCVVFQFSLRQKNADTQSAVPKFKTCCHIQTRARSDDMRAYRCLIIFVIIDFVNKPVDRSFALTVSTGAVGSACSQAVYPYEQCTSSEDDCHSHGCWTCRAPTSAAPSEYELSLPLSGTVDLKFEFWKCVQDLPPVEKVKDLDRIRLVKAFRGTSIPLSFYCK
jgi:hypothetical protein